MPENLATDTFTRIDFPVGDGYMVLNPDGLKRKDSLLADLAEVGRRRSPDVAMPRHRVPGWADAGKRRDTFDAVEALGKVIAKNEVSEAHGGKDVRKIVLVPGWAVERTDGHVAICRKTVADLCGVKPTYPNVFTFATLSPDVWRAYARVRTCRWQGPKSPHGVWWTAGDGDLALHAQDRVEDVSATEIVACQTRRPQERLMLSDKYVWPLRGIDWTMRVTQEPHPQPNLGAAVFESGDVCIVIMGIRE